MVRWKMLASRLFLTCQSSGAALAATPAVPALERGCSMGVFNKAQGTIAPTVPLTEEGPIKEDLPQDLEGDRPQGLAGMIKRKVVEAQEAERRRIARDIHDEAGQLLGSALFRLDMCLAQLPEAARAVEAELLKVKKTLLESVRSLQHLSHSLRPSLLDDLGLVPTLNWYFRTSGLKDSLKVHWQVAGLEGRLRAEVETALFRIIQEACNNVLKHAQARNLSLDIRVNHSRVTAVIGDDGVGFDPQTMSSPDWSKRGSVPMGLAGMKERAELVNGKLAVRSGPGRGTRVIAVIPIP